MDGVGMMVPFGINLKERPAQNSKDIISFHNRKVLCTSLYTLYSIPHWNKVVFPFERKCLGGIPTSRFKKWDFRWLSRTNLNFLLTKSCVWVEIVEIFLSKIYFEDSIILRVKCLVWWWTLDLVRVETFPSKIYLKALERGGLWKHVSLEAVV